MGCPGAFLNRQIARKSSFVHTLVQLKEVRMSVADSDPKDIRHPFFRKRPKLSYGKKKCPEGYGCEFFLEQISGWRFDGGEKSEGEMNLPRWGENQAAIMRIERCERLGDLVGQIDGDEEALSAHDSCACTTVVLSLSRGIPVPLPSKVISQSSDFAHDDEQS